MKLKLNRYLIATLAIGALALGAYAGTGTISNAVPGATIFASDFNKITGALKGDLVPRNSSGVAEAEAGNLGSSTYPFGALFFGDPASQIQLSDAGNEINFRVGGNIEARIGTSGLTLDSLADGLITYAKLNSDAIFKLKSFNGTASVPAGVTKIIVIGCGGGGGGGAGAGAAGNFGGGGGGGSGATLNIVAVPVTALSTVTISAASGGAGATGAAGSGASGSTGGTTTVTVTGHGTLRFAGGTGGTGGTAGGAGGAGAVASIRGGGVTTAGGTGATQQSLTGGTDGDFSPYAAGGAFNATYGSATTGGGGGGGGAGYGAGGQGGAAGAAGIAPPTNGSTGGTCAGGGGGGGAANAGNGANGGTGGAGYAEVFYVAP